jgi:hypothetical protein
MIRVYSKTKGDKVLNYFLCNTNNLKIDIDTFNTNDKTPIVFRGMARSFLIKECVKNKVDFYYVDTGYFPQMSKRWHRFSKNNFQVLNHLSSEEISQRTDIKTIKNKFYEITKEYFDDYKPITKINGSKILIAPPTLKVFKHYDYKVSQWISETIEKIKKFTDKEIIVRQKPKSRKIRINDDKFLDQLKKEDIHCVVTFSSIISVEAILNGYPVITLGPNAASYLSESKIENIENPYFPDADKIKEHMLYLSACQFKKEDFLSGYALKTVNELQHDQKYLDFKL